MVKSLAASALILFFTTSAFSMTLDWAGTYRLEYLEVDNALLADPQTKKSYFLNHLNLSPKIVATDGVNVVANFEVLANSFYPSSQLGSYFGDYGTSTQVASISQTHPAAQLLVNQLYVNINHEYGSLLAGRAPIQFGLGMTHNAGLGLFDHWSDTHDVVGYKFFVGNLSFMPMMGKIKDGSTAQGGDASEMIWDILYDNKDTESTFGLFYQSRTVAQQINDADKVFSGNKTGEWSTQHTNIYLARGWEKFKFKLEAGFQSGSTGLTNASGEAIKLSGYGFALDLDFPLPESEWHWSLKAGIASGDNPSTDNFEGYFFDRNYGPTMLLFNHVLGGYDLFSSKAQKSCRTAGTPCSAYYANNEVADEEVVSNAIYLAPKFDWKYSEKWTWTNTVAYATLQTNPVAGNEVDKNIGIEWDTGLVYKPNEKFQWVNELGLLSPGSAFKEGTVGRGNNFTYGFQSRVAVSF